MDSPSCEKPDASQTAGRTLSAGALATPLFSLDSKRNDVHRFMQFGRIESGFLRKQCKANDYSERPTSTRVSLTNCASGDAQKEHAICAKHRDER